MGRFKRDKPRTATVGFTPVFYWTNEGAKNANEFMKFGDRMQRGRELVVLEAAGIMRREIQSRAPNIDGQDYAQNLEIVLLTGGADEWSEGAAVVHPAQTRTITSQDKDTALYISSVSGSPGYVPVLKKYGPWPASLLPVKLKRAQARVVARRVTQSEIAKLTRQIVSKRRRIESDLRSAGLSDVDLTQSGQGIGTSAQNDLGFAVLRFEFGIQERQIKHWQPALKRVERDMKALGKKFVEYVSTGKEGVFSIPSHGKVSSSDLDPINKFQDAIVRASGF